MSKGSILLQFIVFVSVIYIILTLPEIYETIRFVLIFIPFLIVVNIVKMAIDS